MNSVLMAKIDSLPVDKQQEVETFVQYLVDRYTTPKPVDASVIDKRRKGFESLNPNVFSTVDFDEKTEEKNGNKPIIVENKTSHSLLK